MSATVRLVIVYEPEAAATARLMAAGFSPEIAAEIATYLAQATDLVAFMPELTAALVPEGIEPVYVPLDDFMGKADQFAGYHIPTIVWSMTEGFAYFRGSAVAAAARLVGLPVYGSPPQALHLCQDKFKVGALAAAAGLRVPATALYAGADHIAGDSLDGSGPYFVKPNRLGAKLGIFADSKAMTLKAAIGISERLEARYCDRAVVQRFIPGDDVRVSFMRVKPTDGIEKLGIFRMRKDKRSEVGGDFLTMLDNASLSGTRDMDGTVGAFGQQQAIAFTPQMENLRDLAGQGDVVAASIIAQVEAMVTRAIALFDLRDYYSFDFRVDADGIAHFLEFEVGPGVTIYDFQAYLKGMHGLGLGPALSQAIRLSLLRPLDA